MPTAANYVAFTAPINPPGATPVLTVPQIWAGLQLKIRAAQDFVGGAIKFTDVLEETTDPDRGLPVVVRDIVFGDGDHRIRERCKSFEPMKVEFWQPNGNLVCNIVSDGVAAHPGNLAAQVGQEEGRGTDLYMTYTFEWWHEGMGEEGLKGARERERKMAKTTVESTIVAMREMVRDGRIKA